LKRAYPDRRKLEAQCISAVAFVRNESDVLEQPCWVMLINVVAMDMLKSKIPPVKNARMEMDIRTRPRIPVPDEDPYSIAVRNGRMEMDIRTRPRIPVPDEDPYFLKGSRSSGSSSKGDRSRDRPPKLPPRDAIAYGHPMPKPDYEGPPVMEEAKFRQQFEQRNNKKADKKHDDPYYCGLRARIPNFAKSKQQKEKESKYAAIGREIPGHPNVWHRGYEQGVPQNKIAMDPIYAGFSRTRPFERNPTNRVPSQQPGGDYETDYSHIYGRLPLPYGRFRQYPSPSHPTGRQIY